jgi:hypothetical protein
MMMMMMMIIIIIIIIPKTNYCPTGLGKQRIRYSIYSGQHVWPTKFAVHNKHAVPLT